MNPTSTSPKNMSKTSNGNFFEDFRVGQEFHHATPRTLTEADAALNVALYGSRFAINSSDVFARAIGLPRAPLDDMLVFHVVIGKTVPDISLNAVANLGWEKVTLPHPVCEGDTIYASSEVLEIRESKSRPNVGIVRVKTVGRNQSGTTVIEFLRTFMIWKRGHVPSGRKTGS